MKRLFIVLLAALALGALWVRFGREGEARAIAEGGYRTVVTDRGSIIGQVTTTGAISPTTTVIVGSQLSGQVVEILADYNSAVTTGQVLARLNSDQIRARLDGARADHQQVRATLGVQEAQTEKARADMARAEAVAADMRAQSEKSAAQLADAEKTLQRQSELESRGFASQVALQAARTQRDTLRAQRNSSLAQIDSASAQMTAIRADLKVIEAQMLATEAQIAQRAAMVRQIEVDLANTEIRSPVDGVVIQRNVELGMPVAASLQAPTLFLVAQDLRKIEIQANVDEADVGRVQVGQTVSFTVNAYPGRTFAGSVKQVRLGSQTVQNVVIYATVISVENGDLALRPGMTANLRILTERREAVVRVPNAALRWRPPAAQVLPGQGTALQPSGRIGDSPAGPFAGSPEGPPGMAGGPRRGGPGGNPAAALVERVRGELALTPEQSGKLDALLAELRTSGQRDGPTPTREERQRRGQEMRAVFIERIEALLTAEQRALFLKMRDEARTGQAQPGPAGPSVPGLVYRIGPSGEPQSVTLRLGANDGAFTEVVSGLGVDVAVIVGGAPAKARGGGLSSMRFGF